ncbi:MAG: nitronate monooxygenase, partial [Actinomycetota bacterium]
MTLDSAFTRMFGCRFPIQLAGMGGFASADLAAAVSAAGGLGMLSGVLPLGDLTAQVAAMPRDGAFGVSFLMPFLDRRNVEEVAPRCALVEFFYGDPSADLVATVHDAGTLAGWQVGSVDEARAAVDAGCDVVVAQGVEAGGHVRGTTPMLELVAAVAGGVDVPVVAAGGIGDAATVRAALDTGAAGVRVGTRFLAATESVAHPAYVEKLIAAGADDTVLTTAFGLGWPDAPHRVLRSSVAAGEALGSAQRWTPEWPDAAYNGDVSSRA